jgi:hypothetical protein
MHISPTAVLGPISSTSAVPIEAAEEDERDEEVDRDQELEPREGRGGDGCAITGGPNACGFCRSRQADKRSIGAILSSFRMSPCRWSASEGAGPDRLVIVILRA